ncbi:RNA-binding protein [Mucilaginibacter mali]|uniref:RNA-binding protein n=1 Tax=Mucilaginibacter mali TaxID=2740462 RepID=A0A7D4UPD4_9SPHI|nr:RNA-binding protein [Mucilaginibacter mali]QKJ32981.1 RNA-binding protein [Mucilaginibacter mali]
MVKLFVSGFPAEASELEIVQLFDPFGKVVTIKIVIDKITRKCKGFAFLEVEDSLSAQAAIRELNGTVWGDRELTVNYATEKTPPQPCVKTVDQRNKNKRSATVDIKQKRPRISR